MCNIYAFISFKLFQFKLDNQMNISTGKTQNKGRFFQIEIWQNESMFSRPVFVLYVLMNW